MTATKARRLIGEMWMSMPNRPAEIERSLWVNCDDCGSRMLLVAVKRHDRICPVKRGHTDAA